MSLPRDLTDLLDSVQDVRSRYAISRVFDAVYAATADTSESSVTAAGGETKTLANWFQDAPTAWGTAAAADTGTAGATVPLLSGANTWSGSQSFGANQIGGSNFAISGGTFSGTIAGSPTWGGNHTYSGAVTLNGANTVGNGHSFGFADASANNLKMLCSGNAFQINGTSSTGTARGGVTWTQESDTSAWIFTVPAAVSQPALVLGSTNPTQFQVATNLSGTYTGAGGNTASLLAISTSSDTASLNSAAQGYPSLQIARNFGGTGTSGGRIAQNTTLWLSSPITGDTGSQQYQAGGFIVKASANAGGTNDTSATRGSLYGVGFYGTLLAGATNYTLVNALGEVDITAVPTIQTLTVGGTITAGNTLTLTFTSASITGSPLTLTYTVSAGNLLGNIAAGFQNLIMQNAALQAAGVTASIDTSLSNVILTLAWNTNITVTMAASNGGGTETLALGSVVTGSSTRQKLGGSIIRLSTDGQPGGFGIDTAFLFSAQQGAMVTGGWDTVVGFGGSGSPWMLKATGTLIGAVVQDVTGSTGRGGVQFPALATRGIDLSIVNFKDQSGSALALPGFAVAGDGATSVGNGTLSYAAAGLAVDATGFVGSGNATVVSGGGGGAASQVNNYFVGDLIYDSFGGQHFVTTVSYATGAVTGLRTSVQPFTRGSVPASTQATTGGSGLGLTIGVTWGTATTLALQSSGGLTTLGGLAKLASFTVATLPTAAAGNAGTIAYVTDATAPTYRGALVGGGAVKCMVFSDGTAWTSQ